MLTRRVSVTLLSVVLVAVSVLAVQLLFATEWGKLCHPGELIETEESTENPSKESNPPSFVVTKKVKREKTDGACLEDDIRPWEVDCSEMESNIAFPATGWRVDEYETTQEFVRRPDGEYNAREEVLGPSTFSGHYIICYEDFTDTFW